MKIVIIMWVLTLSDLSAEKRIFNGSLNECSLTAELFNQNHKGKYHAGCYTKVLQYDYVPKE